MLEHLFGSKNRYRLMRLFFQEPKRSFFVREITRVLDTQINAVRRELEKLCEMGVVEEVTEDGKKESDATELRKKFYRLNRASLMVPELQALFSKERILLEQHFIDAIKDTAGQLDLLLLTGVFTNDESATTDMLIVGNIKEKAVTKLIEEYEKEYSVSLRYTFMDSQEFFDRRQMMDKFLFRVFDSKHVKVVNEIGV